MPAVALDGPKGVGKTETATRRAATVFELDDDVRRSHVAADPRIILEQQGPVFIDEWQRLPNVWDVVRRSVDRDATPGRFLLAGSASLPAGTPVHSGAGRIASLRMRPMSLVERGVTQPTVSLGTLLTGSKPKLDGETTFGVTDYVHEILSSGFPGIRRVPNALRDVQLDSYLDYMLSKEFPMVGTAVRRPETLRAWLTSYAAATSTTTSYQHIMSSATGGESDKPAKSTTIAYRDVLERMWILEPLWGWSATGSETARLRIGPKHNLADPALAARLLGSTAESLIDNQTGAAGGSLLGALFESLATLCVRVLAQPAKARVLYLRTADGSREIDLIVERQDRSVVAIEVKLASAINEADAQHLHWLEKQIGPRLLDKVILTTGPEAYRRRDGVAVVPLGLLGM